MANAGKGVRRRDSGLRGLFKARPSTKARFLALLLAGAGLASAAGRPVGQLDQLVQGIESRYRSVRTLRAAFTQTYAWGETRRVESGTAYFARGGLMRWDYREPKDKLVVSDGKKLWLYLPEERQVTRSPVKSIDDARVPFPLLVSHFDLRRIFSRIEFRSEERRVGKGWRS